MCWLWVKILCPCLCVLCTRNSCFLDWLNSIVPVLSFRSINILMTLFILLDQKLSVQSSPQEFLSSQDGLMFKCFYRCMHSLYAMRYLSNFFKGHHPQNGGFSFPIKLGKISFTYQCKIFNLHWNKVINFKYYYSLFQLNGKITLLKKIFGKYLIMRKAESKSI